MRVECELVIFDCDGVLVDSEAIALIVMRDALRDAGLPLDVATVRRRFLGRSLASVTAELAGEGIEFGALRSAAMDKELRRRFEAELVAVPGMTALIDRLAVPCCVASSSHVARLHHSLQTIDLLRRFPNAVFSADAVSRGKPHPDLFEHAARRMGAAPAACIVVEDSVPGLMAARAAGMQAIPFAGGLHLADPADRPPVDGGWVEDAASLAALLPLRTG